MQDGIIKGTGNSRYLKSISSFLTQYPTYQDFAAALAAGTLPIDLNGINETGWDQIGTALNKANLLSDETVEAFGDLLTPATPGIPVPDDAFRAIPAFINGGSYTKRTLLNQYTLDGSTAIQIPFSGLNLYKTYVLIITTPEGASSGNNGSIFMNSGISTSGINLLDSDPTTTSSNITYATSPVVLILQFKKVGSSSASANTICANGSAGFFYCWMDVRISGDAITNGRISSTSNLISGTIVSLYQID